MRTALKKLLTAQSGDTLVEVLVATVVLTIILAGAYTVVNRSTRINQNSIERTEVANQLTEQAELLRSMRQAHDGSASSDWANIITMATNSSVTTPLNCSTNPTADNPFFLSTETTTFGEPRVFDRPAGSQLGDANDAYTNDLFDVWIVAERSPGDSPGSNLDDQFDFHVRGCWQGIGGQGEQRSEVILRLRQ